MAKVYATIMLLYLCALSACKPDLGDPPSLVVLPQLLAIKADPAESKPGDPVTYSFLLAGPNGTIVDSHAGWDLCLSPKPPAESNSVASQCNPQAAGASPGQTFQAVVPTQACKLFGPIAPTPEPGRSAIRPRDPDPTGGYYLPVRVRVENAVEGPLAGFAFERIACGLANAPVAVAQQFNADYRLNDHPIIQGVDAVSEDGTRQSLDAGDVVLGAGSTVTFEARFPVASQETFPVYDVQAEALTTKRESLHLSWFATGGRFEHDRTGVEETSTATSSTNRWTAGNMPGPVHAWIVLRDSRGGSAFRTYEFSITTLH